MMAALATLLLVPFGAAVPQRPKPLPQPSEAQLGAPVYPGSTYLADISGGMSMDETYYKAKTGLTPTELSGNYVFDLAKGSNPYMPEHGIIIEPDKQLTAGPPKTAITFNTKK